MGAVLEQLGLLSTASEPFAFSQESQHDLAELSLSNDPARCLELVEGLRL